jgi:ACT domain-containing protein
MKKFIFLLYLSVLGFEAIAQISANGKVLAEKDKPAKFVSVLLLNSVDTSLVKAYLTNDNGEYKLTDIRKGSYIVSINAVGYKKNYLKIDLVENNTVVPLIKLQLEEKILDEVTVTATKSFLEQRADKLVVNVENSATAVGNNALEVLGKIPGVILINDQVTIAGRNNVSILIDGKLSQYNDITQLLKDISASSISKIEVITNPSAKYDAQGGSLINILLKKNSNLGTNANVTLSTGIGVYDNKKEGFDRNFYLVNPSINLNHRKGKINIYGSYSLNQRNWFEYNEFDRKIAPYRFYQTNIFYINVNSNNYRVGLDYYFDKKNTFGFLLSGYNRTGNNNMTNNTSQYNLSSDQFLRKFKTTSNTELTRDNITGNLNWRHFFDSSGNEINFDFDYSKFNLNNNNKITSFITDTTSTFSNQFIDNPVQLFVFKVDYTHPFTDQSKLEVGFKSSFVEINNNLIFRRSAVIDTNRSNDFKYNENINAIYTTFQKQWKKLQLNIGLRAEQTGSTGISKSIKVLDRNYWYLFPSISFSRTIKNDIAVSFQYSRRIDRPTFQQLNPFIRFLDSLTYNKGNPYLLPQLTNAYKLALTYKNQPFFAISYNKIYNIIYQTAVKQEGYVTFATPDNLGYQENLIFELNFPVKIGSKINGFAGNQAIFNHYNADYLGAKYDNQQWNWLAYWQIGYKPKISWNIEVSGYYSSSFLNEFYPINALGRLNLAFQKSFFDNKAKITLNFNDALFSEKIRGSILYQNINASFFQYEESRNVRLSFSYKLGNRKLSAARSRTSASDDEVNRVKVKNN